jgi:septal ring factor EnvC (AmiA/AmiB activator)
MDLTAAGLAALACATAMHSVPHIVKAWRKRSEAESDLIIQALADVKRLTKEAKEDRERLAMVEAELEEVKLARSHSDGQVAVLRMQLERVETVQALWEKRARRMKEEYDDLYDAVNSSSSGKSLPPRKQEDW